MKRRLHVKQKQHLIRRSTSLEPDKKKHLTRAYLLCAFGGHFLTDRFAAGHMRTPRRQLHQIQPPLFGDLLSWRMHDEDNYNGVAVECSGQQWVAYGDGESLSTNANPNIKKAIACLQSAVDQIYDVYTGKCDAGLPPRALDLVPHIRLPARTEPVCQVMANKLYIRNKNLRDLKCTQIEPLSFSPLLMWKIARQLPCKNASLN